MRTKTSGARGRVVARATTKHMTPRPATLREALAYGRAALARHRCARTDAAREAEALLCAAARVTREQLFTHPERALSPAAWRRYDACLARRRAHEPLDYILGFAQFDGLVFKVNRATLIPRPATECLVEAAAAEAAAMAEEMSVDRETSPKLIVADIGTGSGCIAIALANRLPGVKVLATDESAAALRTARTNARDAFRHCERSEAISSNGETASNQITFLKGNLAAPVIASAAKQSRSSPRPLLLVTNPPYIPSGMMRRLPADVRLFEPATALDGGRDGLDFFRTLLDQINASPTGPVTLIGEHLDTQFTRLANEIKRRFPQANPEPILNLAGIIIGTKAHLR